MWYYQLMGETFGPVSASALTDLAAKGTIERDTLIGHESQGPWMPASEVPDLVDLPHDQTNQALVLQERSSPLEPWIISLVAFAVLIAVIICFWLLKKQFSAWDGSHHGLTRAIKESMNDPGSYEHIKTQCFDRDDHLLLYTEFRGKNAFGGVVKQAIAAKVDLNGNVIKIMSEEELAYELNSAY